MQSAVKVLETTELDFSRYGETLFEVLFAGGRMAAGGTLAPEGKRLDTNVRAPALSGACAAGSPLPCAAGSPLQLPGRSHQTWASVAVHQGARAWPPSAAACACHSQSVPGRDLQISGRSATQVLACEAKRAAILPYIQVFQTLLRCVLGWGRALPGTQPDTSQIDRAKQRA